MASYHRSLLIESIPKIAVLRSYAADLRKQFQQHEPGAEPFREDGYPIIAPESIPLLRTCRDTRHAIATLRQKLREPGRASTLTREWASSVEHFTEIGLRSPSFQFGKLRISPVGRLDQTGVDITTIRRDPLLERYDVRILLLWARRTATLQGEMHWRDGTGAPLLYGVVKVAEDETRTLYRTRHGSRGERGFPRPTVESGYLAVAKALGKREGKAPLFLRENGLILYGLGPTPAVAEDGMRADIARDMLERL